MRIGELAEATGATVRALRYYEEQGLLHPERTPSGQRVYTDDAVAQVHWIRALLATGLPSKAIAKLRRCRGADEVTPEQRAVVHAEHARIEAEYQAAALARDRFAAVLAFIGEPPAR
ncbi:MerR family transcriptional regulator [Glycomyces sp. NPDC049804]|uniref:MerR family transcriptional regulator n=1 Tax=Glycomyces sp. NPDC049804 TaxID=3154363 RepID=UPI003444F118